VVARVVVVSGTVLFFIVVVDVVVVVGVGFSTTVVQEVRAKATARSGIRMISFFIVGVVPSQTNRHRCLNQMYFGRSFSELNFG
jgi:membrane-anchored protein YejM (alkaline phosphatase superfamily)